MLNMKIITDIMYLRSAVESSAHSLGFLPGSAEDKLKFYNLPFLDKLDELLIGTKAEKLEEEKRISMFPVNFARGMNWNFKCIILDEAQNTTRTQMKMFLTRLGKNSQMVIVGDSTQIDLVSKDDSGFIDASEKLTKIKDIGFITLKEIDVVRHDVVRKIINAYEVK